MAEPVTEFSAGVSEQLGYYVYRLIDPRDGNTFYVGKGKGNRVFQHANHGEFDPGQDDAVSAKVQTIRSIHKAGLRVVHIIHRHGMDEPTALEVESALIDAYPGLTNIQSGFEGSERGAMNANQINDIYSREVLDNIEGKFLIIKITNYHIDRVMSEQGIVDREAAIYETVRGWWRLSKHRAEQAEYVIASCYGEVVGVYVPQEWMHHKGSNRIEFVGEPAPSEIADKYVGKIIPPQYRKKGMASPCLYTYS